MRLAPGGSALASERSSVARTPLDVALRTLAGALAPGGSAGRLSILIYHRVLASEDSLVTWDPTAAQFDRQMRALANYFTPLPLTEAVPRLANRDLPARAVCVTFDDGYADNVDVALPILARHGVAATFFIASGYLDGGRMWNDTVIESIRAHAGPSIDLASWGLGLLRLGTISERRAAIATILPALKHLPPYERDARAAELADRAGAPLRRDLMMREDQVRLLRSAGMEIGAHTMSHPILTRLGDDDARREIIESRERLGAIVSEPVTLFAYPNGKPGDDYGAAHVRMVKDAGFRAAVSTAWGVASGSADLHQLPRFTPWHRDPAKFTLALLRNRRNDRPLVV